MKIISLCIVVFLSTLFASFGQTTSDAKKSFSIYLLTNRYNVTTIKFIQKNSQFKHIDLLGGSMIDPKKEGIINLESVKSYILKFYPNKEDSGILCINLENKLYQNLKDNESGSLLFNESIEEFSKLIVTIRELRPNVKIGIYGLPYRTYYRFQQKSNSNRKLDPILSLVDYLFPSLYVLFPDKQKGVNANNNYWETNLNTVFNYADRLKKPVIPFIWYMVFPGNNKYGGELLGRNEMKRYIEYIKDYKSEHHSSVEGVVWWEPSKALFTKLVKQPDHLTNEKIELENNFILQKYTNYLKNSTK